MIDTLIIMLLKLKFKITLKENYMVFISGYYRLCNRINNEFFNAKQDYEIDNL